MPTTNETIATNAATIDSGTKITIALLLLGVAIGATYLAKREKRNHANEKSNANEFYEKCKLLLVIPANRLSPELKTGSINNHQIQDLIANALRAYCFSAGDEKGKQIMQAVECSDSEIDYKTEVSVFLQLELFAKSSITAERDKLSIRGKIEPNSNGSLLQIQNLKTARSTYDFYSI